MEKGTQIIRYPTSKTRKLTSGQIQQREQLDSFPSSTTEPTTSIDHGATSNHNPSHSSSSKSARPDPRFSKSYNFRDRPNTSLWATTEGEKIRELLILFTESPIRECHNNLLCRPPFYPSDIWQLQPVGPVLPCSDDATGQLNSSFEQDPLTEQEEELLIGHDLSRLPPRVFRKIPAAITALKKELHGLLQPDSTGQPGLKLVKLDDPSIRSLPKVFTTIVVKRKSCGNMKARIVIRGDQVPLCSQAFLSAPTAAQPMLNIILSVAITYDFKVGMVDISQAFIQSEIVHPDERIVIMLPKWIPMPYESKILNPDEEPNAPPVTHGLLTVRPLYGGRDAPLRWFLTLSSALKKWGWNQLRSDVCVFTKRSHKNSLVGMLLIHVDDIVCAANNKVWQEFIEIMKSFKTGDFEYVNKGDPVTFLGSQIFGHPTKGFGISQDQFIADIEPLPIDRIVKDNKFILKEEKRRTLFRQILGKLLWTMKTRYDVSYSVTKIATDVVGAMNDCQATVVLLKLINKTIESLKKRSVTLWYTPLSGSLTGPALSTSGLATLFAFSDAGYATLANSASDMH